MHKKNFMQTGRIVAVRRSNRNVLDFRFASAIVLFEIEKYFYMENMREILPAYACICVHAYIYSPWLSWQFFNWFVDGDGANVCYAVYSLRHVAPLRAIPMSSVFTISRADKQGGIVIMMQCNYFSDSFKKVM